jgi:hypothetical protein
MWLPARLDPRRFAAPWELRKDGAADSQAEARETFPPMLDALRELASRCRLSSWVERTLRPFLRVGVVGLAK